MQTITLIPVAIVLTLIAIACPSGSVAFAQTYQYDNAGRLTAANYPGGASIRYSYDAAGNVTRVQHIPAPPPALPPDGVIDTPAGDVTINTGDSVDFTGTGADPDGALPLAYRWDFDGGAPESTDEDPGPTVFNTAGTYVVRFHVTDATNLSDPTPDTVTVTVNSPPPPPPPPTGGGNNGGSGKKSGGGSMGWLALLLLAAWLLRNRRRAAPLCALLLSGLAAAQTATWQPMTSPTTENLNAVWGFSANEVYAVGNKGTILFFDGSAWSGVSAPFIPEAINLTAIWGRSPDDLYVGGTSSDPSQTEFLWHYNGSDWAAIILPEFIGLTDIWSPAPTAPLYLISGVKGWQLDASLDPRAPENWLRRGFTERTTGSLTASALLTAIGGSVTDVLMTGRYGGGATQPGAYRNFSRLTFFGSDMHDVYAFSDTQMVIVGDISYVLNGNVRTAGDWSQFPTMRYPYGVWGAAADDFYVVGAESSVYGLIQHYDGTAISEVLRVPSRTFRDVHGFAANNVFAVGDSGMIYRYAAAAEPPTAANYPRAGIVDDYVNAFTGELVYETRDLSVGQGFPISFRRYYASNLTDQRTVTSALGRNWTHNYDWLIETDYGVPGNLVRIVDYRGREYVFGNSSGDWRLEELYSANVSLTEAASGAFLFADLEAERIYAFDPVNRRLIYVEDRNGNRHTLTYLNGVLVAVFDNFANQLAFEYTATGQFGKVYIAGSSTNPEIATTFGYEGGVLKTATERYDTTDEVVTTYGYSSLNADPALLSSVDIGGTVNRVWLYDDRDRVSATALTGGGTFEYGYDGTDLVVTLPGGVTRRLAHNADGRLTSEEDGLGAAVRYTYDIYGRPVSFTDRANRTTSYRYELESGLRNGVTLPGGVDISQVIEARSSAAGVAFYDVTQVVYPNTVLERFEVDANGNTASYRDQETNLWTYTYDADGWLATVTNPLNGATTITRNARGAVASIADHAGNTTHFAYDHALRPVVVQYADGTQSLIDWTGHRVSQVEFASGAVTNYAYDAAGRVVSELRSDGRSTTFGYDAAGDLSSVTGTDGELTTYIYDEFRRVSSVTTPENDSAGFAYDVGNNLLEFTDANNAAWRFSYHPDGVVKTLTTPGGSVVAVDNTGHPRGLVTSVSEGGEQVQFGYDELGRVSGLVDRLERATNVGRDRRGLVTSVAMPVAGFTADVVRNALGQVEQITDAIGGIWGFGYDEQGRTTQATDPLMRETTLDYDERNRVSGVTYSDGVTGTIQYALNGIVSLMRLSDGTEIALDTTPEGRVMGGTNLALGYATNGDLVDSNGIGIDYYADRRIRTVTLAPGRTLSYQYDGNGNLVLLRDWLGGETVIAPTERGRPDLVTYPNGVQTDYVYTASGRLAGINYPSIGEIVLLLAANGQVTSATRNLPGPSEIAALDIQYAFNLASEVDRFGYDARGNVSRDDDRSYVFDAASRLRSYAVTGGSVTLDYDALGNIVASTGPTRERAYVYNYALERPQAMIERDAAGNDLWYYVFTDEGELLYRMNGDGQRQVYHFDEDGNTAFITDDAGAVVQTYFYSPSGMVLDESGQVDNDRKTGARDGARELDGTRLSAGLGYVADPLSNLSLQDAEEFDDGFAAAISVPVTDGATFRLRPASSGAVLPPLPVIGIPPSDLPSPDFSGSDRFRVNPAGENGLSFAEQLRLSGDSDWPFESDEISEEALAIIYPHLYGVGRGIAPGSVFYEPGRDDYRRLFRPDSRLFGLADLLAPDPDAEENRDGAVHSQPKPAYVSPRFRPAQVAPSWFPAAPGAPKPGGDTEKKPTAVDSIIKEVTAALAGA